MGYIYTITNTLNGACYVGRTTGKKCNSRWSEHKSCLRKNKHHSPYLQRAWNKYGENVFMFEEVEYVFDNANIVEAEQRWLDLRRLEFPKHLNYNVLWIAEHNASAMRSAKSIKKQVNTYIENNCIPVDLLSPTGKIYKNVNNIRHFCRKHNLTSTAMSRVIKRELPQHKGWSLLSNPYKEKTFAFISPENKIYEGITRVDLFANEMGIDRKGLSEVHTERKFSYKGWRKYKGDANIPLNKYAMGENSPVAKLKESDVIEIIRLNKEDNMKYSDIADKYNVSYSLVSKIVRGRLWKSIKRD